MDKSGVICSEMSLMPKVGLVGGVFRQCSLGPSGAPDFLKSPFLQLACFGTTVFETFSHKFVAPKQASCHLAYFGIQKMLNMGF